MSWIYYLIPSLVLLLVRPVASHLSDRLADRDLRLSGCTRSQRREAADRRHAKRYGR